MATPKLSLTLSLITLLALGTVAKAGQEYEVVRIGNLHGADWGRAVAINNHNTVVGWSSTDGVKTGFRWSEGNPIENMNVWYKDEYIFTDINDNGHMVGYFREDGITKGFLHVSPGWGTHYLYHNEPTGDFGDSQTFGINNLNHTVGNMGLDWEKRAAGWTIQFGGFLFPGGQAETSQAYAINDSDTTAGFAYVNGIQRAKLFYNNQTVQDLHSMIPGATGSLAGNINDQGSATGIFRDPSGHIWSFLFNPELGMQVFQNISGYDSMSFSSLSGNGVVVGYANPDQGLLDNQAVRWTQGGGVLDLNTLIDPNSGWELDEAYDVNEAGYIVGSGKFNGAYSNYMLRPVPEPATLTALALGSIALLRRRRSR
jgi:hypothetical protein